MTIIELSMYISMGSAFDDQKIKPITIIVSNMEYHGTVISAPHLVQSMLRVGPTMILVPRVILLALQFGH
jgi:hypothetical protein